MILSLHIPKTAGRSFRFLLEASYAPRVLFDYGDAHGDDSPKIVARREKREAEMRARKDDLLRDYDVIHGHFVADKYIGLFPAPRFAAFFRDPYQQSLSHFHFFQRNPQIGHPAVIRFHQERMTITDFIAAFPNVQALFLGSVAVEDLAMVGLTEQYERGIALFEAVFGRRLSPERQNENVNPDRKDDGYPVDEEVRKAVDTYRAGDVETYRRAVECFGRLAARYGV